MARALDIVALGSALLALPGCDAMKGPTTAQQWEREKVIEAGGDPNAKLSEMPVAEKERSYQCGWLARGNDVVPVAVRSYPFPEVLVPASHADRKMRERVRDICGSTLDRL